MYANLYEMHLYFSAIPPEFAFFLLFAHIWAISAIEMLKWEFKFWAIFGKKN